MAITAAREYETMGPVVRVPGIAKASTTFYKGQLLAIDAGYFGPPTDAANKYPIGIYDGTGIDVGAKSLVAPASGMPTIVAIQGKVWVPFTGAAQTDVGLLFFLADNGDVTKTAGNKTWKVPCVGFKTGHVLLDFTAVTGAAA
jgi:hypothetical protein